MCQKDFFESQWSLSGMTFHFTISNRYLQYLPGDLFRLKRFMRADGEIEHYMIKLATEQEQSLDGTQVRDYIDAFLLEMHKRPASYLEGGKGPTANHFFSRIEGTFY